VYPAKPVAFGVAGIAELATAGCGAPKACAAVGADPPSASPSESFCTGTSQHPLPFLPPNA